MFKRYFVRIKSLKEGMRIDQSVIDQTGRTLIARGTNLDTYLIEALQRLGITGVYCSEGEEELLPTDSVVSTETLRTIERLKVPDRPKVNLSDSVKERVAEGMQYLFSNTKSDNLAETTNNIADMLMSAILENDAVAVDINILKCSDEYTFKHSVDVATMAIVLGRKMRLKPEELHEIGVAGLLHDLGKSKIPSSVLNKAGKLTDEEFSMMKQHSVLGYNMIKDKTDISENVKMGVLQHHEKLDGRGYPMGLQKDQIHPYASILTVVDIYDALVTDRPYKNAFSPRDAVEMMMTMTAELDIKALRGFLRSVILYPMGSQVELSNGEKAVVVDNGTSHVLRPKVVGLGTGKVYNLADDINCANIIIL